jgi:hypothetical protein
MDLLSPKPARGSRLGGQGLGMTATANKKAARNLVTLRAASRSDLTGWLERTFRGSCTAPSDRMGELVGVGYLPFFLEALALGLFGFRSSLRRSRAASIAA